MADEKKTPLYFDSDDHKPTDERFESPSLLRKTASMPPSTQSSLSGHPALPILSYCGSSILMTVTNKYVLSGLDFNLNFLLLCIQVSAAAAINRECADTWNRVWYASWPLVAARPLV